MIRRALKRIGVILCCLGLFFPMAALAAPELDLDASMGYDGAVTYVRRLPVSVRITNNGADATGILVVDVDRSVSNYDCYRMPLTIAAGATVSVRIPVVLTLRQKAYTVRWMVDGETASQAEIVPESIIAPTAMIVGVLSDDPRSLAYMGLSRSFDPLARGEYWSTVPLTVDTFPDQLEDLRFFDILAVDGIDLTVLHQQQKDALEQWLMSGGVILVGGGAHAQSDFSFFTSYTGISAGTLTDGGDVSEALLSAFELSGATLNQSVMISPLEGASGLSVGENHLIDVCSVGQGRVITAAFALGEEPLAAWLGRNAMWQRVLISHAREPYARAVESRQSGSYATDGNNRYVNDSIIDLIGIPNSSNAVLPMVIIAVFLVLAGFGSYLVLKKFDKREWMWAAVPALAVVASLSMWAVSGLLPLRQPAAVSYTVVRVYKDGVTDAYTAVSAAKAGNEAIAVGVAEGNIDMASTVSYYASSDDANQQAAATMRYMLTYGEREELTTPVAAAWNYQSFILKNVPIADLTGVRGTCHWMDDSLVFEITNASDVQLDQGVIFSEYGFVSVPAIAPGEAVTATLSPAPSNTGSTTTPVLKDGVMLDASARNNYSSYSFADTYTAYDRKTVTSSERDELLLKRFLLTSVDDVSNGAAAQFYYFTFPGNIAELKLTVDGQPVTRAAQYDMLAVQLDYRPVADDGSVRFLKGSFPVYSAEIGEDGVPVYRDALNTSRYNYRYFTLAASPVFAFDMSAIPEGFKATKFDISPMYNYQPYKISLYNKDTKQWDEYKLNDIDRNTGLSRETAKLPEVSRYVVDGYLYARFEKRSSSDDGVDISMPILTVDGRVD